MMRTLSTFVALAIVCGQANAYTECKGVVTGYFTDTAADTGGPLVWVAMPRGLQWYVMQSDPDSKNIVAGVTVSMTTGMPIVVRFQANGVACDSTSGVRTDVLGMWLVPS